MKVTVDTSGFDGFLRRWEHAVEENTGEHNILCPQCGHTEFEWENEKPLTDETRFTCTGCEAECSRFQLLEIKGEEIKANLAKVLRLTTLCTR